MRILHLLRKPPGPLFRELLERQSLEHELTVVLIPGAHETQELLPGRVLTLSKHAGGKSTPDNPTQIGYPELLDLIFQQDRVFCR